jgi:ribonuclease PH
MLGYEIKQEVSKQLGGHTIDWHGQSAAVAGSQIILPALNDDLDYPEDSNAGTDGNFVLTGRGRLVEVQMSAEGSSFSHDDMLSLLALAKAGCADLVSAQKAALGL